MTCSARIPRGLHTGALCWLIEGDDGLILVDTGLGQADYVDRPAILRAFRMATILPFDPEQAAVCQIRQLGFAPDDVRHIVLTHLHFDHAGGVPDFPDATVHLHRRELEAFTGKRRHWLNFAYVRRHLAHDPRLILYETAGDRWFRFPAVRLPLGPEMWLVPLFGHTPGHCGVAIRAGDGWYLHAGDAIAPGQVAHVPGWVEQLVLGPHGPRLRAFAVAHPEIPITAGHMPLGAFVG